MTPPESLARPPAGGSTLRLTRYLVRLLISCVRYATATRRFSLVAAVVLGLVLLALTVTA